MNARESQNERIAQTGLAAVVCGTLAGIGGLAASQLDAFSPCRVLYRIPQAVQDSLACHIYSAMNWVSLFFLVAAVGSGVAAAALSFVQRRVRR